MTSDEQLEFIRLGVEAAKEAMHDLALSLDIFLEDATVASCDANLSMEMGELAEILALITDAKKEMTWQK